MQSSDKPSKFNIPFANGGSKRTIPQSSQIGITDGAASLTDGFPPLTFIPTSAGGKGPSGLDFNGLLNQITAAERWTMAGAGYPWDSAFSSAIGGYPKGARVLKSDGSGYWQSTTENNITNPDTGGAGWVSDLTNKTITAGKVLGRDTSGNGVVQELPIAVDSNGNVGIGVFPNYKVDIASSGLSATLTPILSVSDGVNSTIQLSQTTTYSQVYANNALSFGVYGAERARIDSSGNFLFNSGYGSVATAYGVRAWVKFNGTGATGAQTISASGNISSVVKNNTGTYTVNFASAMHDANYVANVSAGTGGGVPGNATAYYNNITSSSFQIQTYSTTGSAASDFAHIGVSVIR